MWQWPGRRNSRKGGAAMGPRNKGISLELALSSSGQLRYLVRFPVTPPGAESRRHFIAREAFLCLGLACSDDLAMSYDTKMIVGL
jgi:hypothetical protein